MVNAKLYLIGKTTYNIKVLTKPTSTELVLTEKSQLQNLTLYTHTYLNTLDVITDAVQHFECNRISELKSNSASNTIYPYVDFLTN